MILRSGFKTLVPPGVVRRAYTKPINAPAVDLPVIQEMSDNEEPAPGEEGQAQQGTEQPAQNVIIINGHEDDEETTQKVKPIKLQARYQLPPPHKFAGTENVHHWLQDFESYCTLTRISDEDRAALLYYNLAGLALSWVRNQPAEIRSDYNTLRHALIGKFDTEHSRWKKRHEIHGRKQLPTEPVASYIKDMRQLFADINKTEEQIQVFCDNLREELKKFVYSKTVHSLDEAEEAATLVESLYPVGGSSMMKEINQLTELVKSLKPLDQPKQQDLGTKDLSTVVELVQSLTPERNSRTVDGRPKCFNCNRPGHMARTCLLPRNQTMQGRFCRYCRKLGHSITECRAKKPAYCNICQKPGHLAQNCRQRQYHRQVLGSALARRTGPLNY